jgi:hypothetical protein
MRRAALELYSRPYDLSQKLQRAGALDSELQQWLSQIPLHLKLHEHDPDSLRNPRRRAVYARKQSIVLRLRKLLIPYLEDH